MIDMTYSIDPRVDLIEAFQGFARANGKIALGLRYTIMLQAQQQLRKAEWIQDGAKRHRAIKRARDQIKTIRNLDLRRRGWK